MAKLYIGTSGWIYGDWQDIFYPEDLTSKDKLKYFSQFFSTTEINYSFYHLPRPTTYQKWYEQTPADFVFAVKISRFISHIKKLKDIAEAWQTFYQNSLQLKEKLGPFLLQLPPSFKYSLENSSRIKDFLVLVKKTKKGKIRLAIEVRNSSFQNQQFFRLLKKYNTALVISDSSHWPKIEEPTLADFVYIRFHGPTFLFASSYSQSELKNWAMKIKQWQKNRDVYVYFNNDVAGYAIKNAQTLINLVVKK
ncbi:MAG: DUF72 domain-containing protein [Minisyncoccales bacterium]